MNVQDAIAGYAAVLSTFVAAVQFSDWQRKRHFLAVSVQEMFGNDGSQWEVLISNRGEHPVRLLFVAYGTCERTWRRGFRFVPDSLHSVSELIRNKHDSNLDHIGATVEGRTLLPGETVEVAVQHYNEEMLKRMQIPGLPFMKKRCVWIEHSQSEYPVIRMITAPIKDNPDSLDS